MSNLSLVVSHSQLRPVKVRRKILETLRLLRPQKVEGSNKIRVGTVGDGGYVQIDDLVGVRHALSFGVSDNDS